LELEASVLDQYHQHYCYQHRRRQHRRRQHRRRHGINILSSSNILDNNITLREGDGKAGMSKQTLHLSNYQYHCN
jgi:hypothetical protein